MEEKTLLVTSAARPSKIVNAVLLNEGLRVLQTKAAIYATAAQNIFPKIVICDGTNQVLFNEKEIDDFEAHGVRIEQIFFQQDQEKVTKQGKSIGEIEIVRHALAHSNELKECGSFYKLTARYLLLNAPHIVQALRTTDNFFYYYYPRLIRRYKPHVQTAFYKASPAYILKVFDSIEDQVDDYKNVPIETALGKQMLAQSHNNLYIQYPRFYGVSGTHGTSLYSDNKVRNGLYSLFSWCGLLGCSFKA